MKTTSEIQKHHIKWGSAELEGFIADEEAVDFFNALDKSCDNEKWINKKDIEEILNNWDCQDNPDIKRTINTLLLRINS